MSYLKVVLCVVFDCSVVLYCGSVLACGVSLDCGDVFIMYGV